MLKKAQSTLMGIIGIGTSYFLTDMNINSLALRNYFCFAFRNVTSHTKNQISKKLKMLTNFDRGLIDKFCGHFWSFNIFPVIVLITAFFRLEKYNDFANG